MYCPKCGKQLQEGAKFCIWCGNPISGETEPGGSRPPGHPRDPGPENRKKTALAAAGAVLLLAAAAIWIMSPWKDRGQQTAEPVQEMTTLAPRAAAIPETAPVQKSGDAFVLPPDSARDDGNLFGNTHCYARMAYGDGTLYFRNPWDLERTYAMDDGRPDIRPFGDLYMKDIHLFDGYLYYCRTSEGDVSNAQFDWNLYRIRLDGTENTRLTDIRYGQGEAWLSFDTMVDGRCYFTYSDGTAPGYRIGAVNLDGSGFSEICFIPQENCSGLPGLNVMDRRIYYKAGDGLNCFDMDQGQNRLVIPGAGCIS